MKKYREYDTKFPIISNSERILVQAECEARVGSLSEAQTLLNIVRKLSGLSDFTNTDQSAVIVEILKQKYMQLFLEGQSYHDMRRTGTLPDNSIPKRWIYPQSETNANPFVPADDESLVKDILP
jgi:hypothetical protein